MTHEDAGHYRIKHPAGTTCDPTLADALAQKAPDDRLSCTAAHQVAAAAQVAPAEIGKTADLLELRIVECQMGLFGYSPEKRIVRPAPEIAPGLRAAIDQRTIDGIIGCSSCWQIAAALGITKMAVASACEALGLKIKPCQLGAF